MPFALVGLGASAGGLAAIREFLQGLGEAPAVAVIVVQHQDRSQPSELSTLLAAHSPATVLLAHDGLELEAGHVYVAPPDAAVTVVGGALRLTPRTASAGLEHPIDRLLHSLASVRAAAVIGVVLSGTGADGSLGTQEIKAAGGITLAQDGSAQFTAMPRAAIASGCVDFVLSPQAIAAEVLRVAARPAELERQLGEGGAFGAILAKLRQERAIDFAGYKEATLRRRLQRRLFVRQVASLEDYQALLEREPAEVSALAEEMLIHVTQFFRDPQVFEALKRQVFPQLLQGRTQPLRVWVPGCWTGEEVYSLAMCLVECASQVGALELPLKVFGTDASKLSIATARAARYSEGIEQDVSRSRLEQFFERAEGGYRVRPFLRDLCVFSTHDATRDPPFSQMDLVSCRNLMIYLAPALQERLLPRLHHALREPGVLLLGPAESTRGFAGFAPLDAKHNIFTRVALPAQERFDRQAFTPASGRSPGAATAPVSSLDDALREADRLVLSQLAPPGVVVSQDLRIVQFRGRTAAYLEPSPGLARFDLLRMAREELRQPLREAFEQARASGQAARAPVTQLSAEPNSAVVIEVVPLSATPDAGHFLVLFREGPAVATSAVAPSQQVEQLRGELRSTRQGLESAIEQLESRNATQRAANEEITSSNEELRALNDELEAAKEELRAANQELTTLNDELVLRSDEGKRLTNDLTNVLSSVPVPLLLLDRDLRLRRYSRAAADLLEVAPADVGTPMTERQGAFAATCVETARLVPQQAAPVERTIQDEHGALHLVAARPYISLDGTVDGAILSILDVDAVTGASFREILSGATEAIVMVEERGQIVFANTAAASLFGHVPAELLGQRVEMLLPEEARARHGQDRQRYMSEAAPRAMGRGREVLGLRKDGTTIPLEVVLSPMRRKGGALAVAFIRDMTERRGAEHSIKSYQEKLQRMAFDAAVAEERERRRIATDLHDQIGQSLALARIKLSGAREAAPAATRTAIDECLALLGESLTATRTLTFDLSPPILYDLGLKEALSWLAEDMEKRYGMSVELHMDATPTPLKDINAALVFRAVRELLLNVFKHAQSPAARVTLTGAGQRVEIAVEDQGVGFDAAATRHGSGFGLFSVREQVQRLGGMVEIESVPRQGTRVKLQIPLAGPASAPSEAPP